jgi:diguanylate cyclase (GGDEF)-like protein
VLLGLVALRRKVDCRAGNGKDGGSATIRSTRGDLRRGNAGLAGSVLSRGESVHYGCIALDIMEAVGVTDAVVETESIEEALRTALDLCLGLGAFVVTMTGAVHRVLSDAMPPDDGWRRIEVLARNCLSHPAAHGHDLFWNAEVSTEAGSADRSLACVVMPIWSGQTEVGLLAVVDTWLPEPDGYQRAGLARLSDALARVLSRGPAGAPQPAPEPEGPEPAGAEAGVETPRPDDVASHIDAGELMASLDDGIMCLDASGIVVLSNRSADAMHGLPPGRSLVGSALPKTSALRTEDGQVLANDRHPAVLALEDGIAREVHLTIGEEGDGQRHLAVSARPFPIEGQRGVLVVLHDTTAQWMEQQRLTHYALYDPLTGLANRYLLLEELRRMLQGLGRRGGSVALIYMDLDDFKRINDEHGHDMGDDVLGAFARRLRGAVRSDDVVARLGGDEFVIAHATADGTPDGDLVVSRLRKVLSAPFTVRGLAFDVGASIGWVSTEKGDVGPDALLARADRAMYRHKRDRTVARRSAS